MTIRQKVRLGKSACPRVLDDQKKAVDDQKLMSGCPHDDQNLFYDHLNFRPQSDDFSHLKGFLKILKITFFCEDDQEMYVDDQSFKFGRPQTPRI